MTGSIIGAITFLIIGLFHPLAAMRRERGGQKKENATQQCRGQ
jgi:hypothetical protein